MTIRQVILFAVGYSLLLIVVVYFTRATARRFLGALAGGLAADCIAVGMMALAEARGWWHVPMAPTLYFSLLFWLVLAISMSPSYLIMWRLARRFGWRGPAVYLAIIAVIGPPRDYLIAAMFPQWMVFAPGVAPIVADCAAYVGMVVVGYAAMRLVAAPADKDRLARQELSRP